MKAHRVDAQTEREMLRLFPDLMGILAGEHPSPYEYRAVSFFQEWVGVERLDELTATSAEEDAQRNRPLNAFSEALLENTRALKVAFDEESAVDALSVFTFSSTSDAQSYARPGDGRSETYEFFAMLLPELRAVYLESWEYTNVLYLLDDSVIPVIERLAKQAGAFVLKKDW